jgi:hypothetical protein
VGAAPLDENETVTEPREVDVETEAEPREIETEAEEPKTAPPRERGARSGLPTQTSIAAGNAAATVAGRLVRFTRRLLA